MADTPVVTRRDHRGTEGVIKDADPEGSKAKSTSKDTSSSSSGVTAANVSRTERPAKADEGTRSFGAPLSTTGADTTRQRDNQSTDSSQ